MKDWRFTKLLLASAGIIATLLLAGASVLAQCAMCKNAVTGSPSAAKLSESLNLAIIVLLIPPVLIFCGIFLLAYRYRKGRGKASPNTFGDDLRGQDAAPEKFVGQRKKRKTRSEREAGGAPA